MTDVQVSNARRIVFTALAVMSFPKRAPLPPKRIAAPAPTL